MARPVIRGAAEVRGGDGGAFRGGDAASAGVRRLDPRAMSC